MLPYYENPANDNEVMLNLQKEYKDGNEEALSRLYLKLYELAIKTINARARKSKKLAALSKTERESKAENAATYIIEQYITRPDFYITKNMKSYLYLRIQHELHYMRKCDKMMIFTDFTAPSQRYEDKKNEGYLFVVRNVKTGNVEEYSSASELYLNPKYKGLKRKTLAECIRTGTQWRCYAFDLIER
ncbi:MAG: hypothetical protein K6B75_06070 [Lachnospiraceae bacterium]|nr:hypothetical protein [Lachnospiraceae bacterium]